MAAKKRGRFLVLQADPRFVPPTTESHEVYGMRLTQPRDDDPIDPALPTDVQFGLIVLRYTQSNSAAYVKDGATLGIGAGQQSRIDCTRIAARRGPIARLEVHIGRPDVRVGRRAPFRDNVDEAARHGVRVIAEPGGSVRSSDVANACREHGITLLDTGMRIFHH